MTKTIIVPANSTISAGVDFNETLFVCYNSSYTTIRRKLIFCSNRNDVYAIDDAMLTSDSLTVGNESGDTQLSLFYSTTDNEFKLKNTTSSAKNFRYRILI